MTGINQASRSMHSKAMSSVTMDSQLSVGKISLNLPGSATLSERSSIAGPIVDDPSNFAHSQVIGNPLGAGIGIDDGTLCLLLGAMLGGLIYAIRRITRVQPSTLDPLELYGDRYGSALAMVAVTSEVETSPPEGLLPTQYSSAQDNRINSLMTFLASNRLQGFSIGSLESDEDALSRIPVCVDTSLNPSHGLGAFATKAIEEGEIIFEIPRILTVEEAFKDPNVGGALRAFVKKAGPGSELPALALAIAAGKCRTMSDCPISETNISWPWSKSDSTVSDTGGTFDRYAASLDFQHAPLSHVTCWPQEDVDAILDDIPEARSEADSLLQVSEVAQTLLARLLKPLTPPGTPQEELAALVRTSLALVLTRVFDPPDNGAWGNGNGKGPAMVPLFDLINHAPVEDPQCNARLEVLNGTSVAGVVRARRRIEVGDELRQDYGHASDKITMLLTHRINPSQQP
uniref:SET domain-containing protein n=1 Tax=Eutreptiella gymnastica TaxID=73025 RepID=A0A6U8FVY5_9EUGL|mmetsp:Transcript_45487/g.81382  ORF Transcript_45487/g.81382 Transcript_45487/m.81382 type:complete len:459 (+) Transcript_45487:109-1485(+)